MRGFLERFFGVIWAIVMIVYFFTMLWTIMWLITGKGFLAQFEWVIKKLEKLLT